MKKQTEENERLKEIIALWKNFGVLNAAFDFNAGGDSMEELNFSINLDRGKAIEFTRKSLGIPLVVLSDDDLMPMAQKKAEDEFGGFFHSIVEDNIEFYCNSDGNYVGEYGVVEISPITSDADGEIIGFRFDKNTTSQWEETHSEETFVELTSDEAEFFRNHVQSMFSEEYVQIEDIRTQYSTDLVLTDKVEELENSIREKMVDTFDVYEFKDESVSEKYQMDYGGMVEAEEVREEDGKHFLVLTIHGRFEEAREGDGDESYEILIN